MGSARTEMPLVVKVGGSLAESGRLVAALDRICNARRPIVVVPGGGAFVDKVRDLQLALRFDDVTAHRLALLGMHQMAELFVRSESRLKLAESIDDIHHVLATGFVPVWVPLPTLDRDTSIPADWSITSDGIAARLAELLGGAPLVLLKSVDVADDAAAIDLVQDGIIDSAFPNIVARAGLDWRIFGPSADAALTAYLHADSATAGKG